MDTAGPGSPASVLAIKKWKCIYPVYINGKKTVAEGRRLNKSKFLKEVTHRETIEEGNEVISVGNCVDNPTCQEIKDILENAGLRVIVEPRKMYARDPTRELTFQGRVRVELLNDNNEVINDKFPHKLAVLHYLGDTIPKLKGRASSSQQTASASSGTSQGGGAGKGKQKGKGGKRK